VPERNHSSYGVVRAILRDGNDFRINGTLPFFLDSDGCVSYPECPGAERNVSMVSPGAAFLPSCTRFPHPPLPPAPASLGVWHVPVSVCTRGGRGGGGG
jgi:hypothetical protein